MYIYGCLSSFMDIYGYWWPWNHGEHDGNDTPWCTIGLFCRLTNPHSTLWFKAKAKVDAKDTIDLTVNPTVVKSSLRLIFGSLASGNQTSQWKIHHLYISMIFWFTLPINFGDFAKNHGWLLGYVSYVPQKLVTTLLDHPRMTQPPSSDRSWEALTIRSICQIGQPIWLWFSVACWACWSGNPGDFGLGQSDLGPWLRKGIFHVVACLVTL